ncbi:MAG: ROK family glucokinase [Lachnospiraceae bacterium]|nr:ROK family glucokinase [Lachnospiraceae bacterium]MBR3638396.1 ROK family glucokinase [Lachnospiraceae bacterium]
MAQYVFAVDLGGTTVKLGLFDKEGNVLEKWEIVTRKENNGENILPDIAKSIKDKAAEKNIAKEDILGVGIGVPGPVDSKGTIYKAANLGWDVFNVSETLGELTGLPVKTGNDANVAALGEMWKGGGKGYDSIVAVTLGTGVGGGVIIEGKLVAGSTGAGGEIGHIHVEDNETISCGCGKKGCLEQYASATGIARLANERLAQDDMPSSLRSVETIDAKAVFDAVKAGDALAIEVAEIFGMYLGKGLAAVAAVVNPEAFVIGGGVSKAGEVLFEYIEKNYVKYAFHGTRNVKFCLATLGNDAGIYGAAKLILE